MSNYNWIDNPTENGIAICDTDVLNECLMHLKYNNQKIKNKPFCFNYGNINSFGNSDVFDFDALTEAVLNVADSYTLYVPTAGYYSIALVGGGGSGVSGLNSLGYGSYCGGGSGAAFVGEVYLNVGNHNITVGGQAGDSILYDENGNALITAGGGTNGAMTDYNLNRAGGYGGTLTIASGVQTQNVTVQSNGNDGGFSNANVPQSGGASVYNGYGKGSDSLASNFTIGYFSIELGSGDTNVSYKVGGSYPALTGTLANGEQFTLNGLNSDDITGLADGSYIKYVGSDGSSELLKANLIVAKTVPSTPANNDVWINNSVSPLSVKKYTATNYIVYGSPTITENGIITSADTSSNIVAIDYDYGSNDFIFYGNIITKETAITGDYLLGGGGYGIHGAFMIAGYPNAVYAQIYVNNTDDSTTDTLDFTLMNSGLQTNTKYDYYFKRENNSYTVAIKKETDTEWTVTTPVTSSYNPVNAAQKIVAETDKFEVDFSEFKIYLKDVLVYEPSIPNGWVDYNKVPLGKITLSSGGITAVKTFPYNIDYISNNIVETYQNGSDWYRVYADGWCEQGGRIDVTGTSQSVAVTLLRSYRNTNYDIQVSYSATGTNTVADMGVINTSTKTTSGFEVYQYYDITLYWQTCGYINNA